MTKTAKKVRPEYIIHDVTVTDETSSRIEQLEMQVDKRIKQLETQVELLVDAFDCVATETKQMYGMAIISRVFTAIHKKLVA
jgi:hypothetical protein